MPSLKPDPTFYPSPTLAMEAPPEELAYVAIIDPDAHPARMPWVWWTSKPVRLPSAG